jgi:hypothetical protein
MTISFPFEQQSTWRQLGYLYFQDSLDYREVLTQNPEWNVTELPPIGAQLRLSPSAGTAGTPGGLTQGSFITGLAPQQNNNDFFPYDTQGEYDEALFRYTLQGVFDRQTINGLNFDTNQAITGLQNG